MMMGGSAGLMTMIALPRCAPPTRSTARAVRSDHRVVIGLGGEQAVNRVAHDDGRLGRIDDDDRLAALRPAHALDGARGPIRSPRRDRARRRAGSESCRA